MNDDLYGYELEDGESIVFAQNQSYNIRPAYVLYAIMCVACLLYYFFVVNLLPENMLDRSALHILTFLIIALGITPLAVRLHRKLTRGVFERPVVVTNRRTLVPNGDQLTHQAVTEVQANNDTLKVKGSKLADGLLITGLPNPQTLKTAIERQLT